MHSFAGVCIVGWMPSAEFSLWLFSLFQAICSMDQRLLLLEATCFVGVRFRFLSFASHFVAIGEIPDWDALPRKLSVWFVCGRVLELCPPPRAHLFIMVRPAQLFLEHKTRCRPVQAVYLLPNDRRNGLRIIHRISSKKIAFFFSNPKNILFIAFQQGHSTCFFHMKQTVRVSKFPFVVKFIIPDARIVLRPPCFVKKFISCSDAYLSVFKFFFHSFSRHVDQQATRSLNFSSSISTSRDILNERPIKKFGKKKENYF